MRDLATTLQLISVMALPFLLAVTWREAARGYVAHRLGDVTPKASGRLKLNPLSHVDPINTVVIPLLAVLLGVPFLIGSGKIMPLDPRNFSNPKWDIVYLAASGIVTNLLIAIFFAYVSRFALAFGASPGGWLVNTAYAGIFLNSVFMVIHLLPVPPLDGAQILAAFLPPRLAQSYAAAAPFGLFIILGIFFLAPAVILVPMRLVVNLVVGLVGVPLS